MAEEPAVGKSREHYVRRSAALRTVRKRDFTGTAIPFTVQVPMRTDTATVPVMGQEAAHTAVPDRTGPAETDITDIAKTEFRTGPK